MAACRQCVDAGFAVRSVPIFSVNDGAQLMTVGQAPGRHEAEQTHTPFSGPAGRRLFRWLAQAGYSEDEFRATQAMTAITLCYPGPHPSGRGDRVPSRAEQTLCAPWLERLLQIIAPQVVIPIGGLAIERVLGGGVKLTECVGQRVEQDGRIIVPLPHPSGASTWFNDASNRERLDRALGHLATLRQLTRSGWGRANDDLQVNPD